MSISSPPNYGSPDWQRGAYSAQKLLASVSAAETSVTVNVPPNAEALVIMASLPSVSAPVICSGLQSGRSYIGARAVIPGPPTQDATYFFDVSGTVDTQVLVALPVASVAAWYVYADAGTRTTMDIANQRSYGGILYTIPSVPSTVAGDHPLNEIRVASAFNAVTGTVLVAQPGAGSRVRLFSYTLSYDNASGFASLDGIGTPFDIAYAIHGADTSLTFPGQGVPYPVNTGIGIFSSAGGGVYATVFFTVETI